MELSPPKLWQPFYVGGNTNQHNRQIQSRVMIHILAGLLHAVLQPGTVPRMPGFFFLCKPLEFYS